MASIHVSQVLDQNLLWRRKLDFWTDYCTSLQYNTVQKFNMLITCRKGRNEPTWSHAVQKRVILIPYSGASRESSWILVSAHSHPFSSKEPGKSWGNPRYLIGRPEQRTMWKSGSINLTIYKTRQYQQFQHQSLTFHCWKNHEGFHSRISHRIGVVEMLKCYSMWRTASYSTHEVRIWRPW